MFLRIGSAAALYTHIEHKSHNMVWPTIIQPTCKRTLAKIQLVVQQLGPIKHKAV